MSGPAAAPGERPPIRISVAWSQADSACLLELAVPTGSRLGDALVLALAQGLPGAVAADPAVSVAVHGRLRGPDQVLLAGDRIELLGPLRVDPKVARERRVAHKRAQQAGASLGAGRSRPRLSDPGNRPGSTAPEPDAGG